MFLDFTLTKGGAFVYCEDASEYDENLPAPQNPEAVQAVQEKLATTPLGYGSVKKVQVKTLPIYQKLNELFRMVGEEPTDSQDALRQIHALRSYVSLMLDELRGIVGKSYGLRMAVNHAWSMMPVINNMRRLVANQQLLMRSRCNSLNMTFQYSGLATSYDIAGYISELLVAADQDFAVIGERSYDDKMRTFESWDELLEVFYSSDIPEEDPRLVSPRTQSSDLSGILEEAYHIQNRTDPYEKSQVEGFARREIFAQLMNFNSIIERRVMIDLHNLYIEFMGTGDISSHRELVSIAMELRNAFIVNLMYAIGCGYGTEIYRYAHASYAEYVATCLATIDEAKLG